MELSVRILDANDVEFLWAWSRVQWNKKFADEMEAEVASWKAPWRKEALQHYLPLGWSFGVFRGEDLLAYSLAQPLLFKRQITQTLWVEYISAVDSQAGELLLDTIYRWSRDKHLQCIEFLDVELAQEWFKLGKGTVENQNIYRVTTTRTL